MVSEQQSYEFSFLIIKSSLKNYVKLQNCGSFLKWAVANDSPLLKQDTVVNCCGVMGRQALES
jgi:hypothetical protein